jgi:hypothetical protein
MKWPDNALNKGIDDLLNTPEAKEFLFHAEMEMFPKLEASAMSMVVCDGRHDAAMAVQLGAMLLMDKPLIVVVVKGAKVPAKLRMIADEVVEVEGISGEQDQQALVQAVHRMKERLKDL